MNRWLPLLTLALASSLPLAAWALGSTGEYTELRAQADRAFACARKAPGKTLDHRIRTLSVALEFHDHPGTRTLIAELSRGCR